MGKFKAIAIEAEEKHLLNLWATCSTIIEDYEIAGTEVHDGNVMELISGKCEMAPNDIRKALAFGGMGPTFPNTVALFDPMA